MYLYYSASILFHLGPVLHKRGVPDRANPKLFLSKTLGDSKEYPHASQKFIKAAASRYMVYFMYEFSKKHEDDTRASLFGALCTMLTVFAEHPCLCKI